MKLGLVFSTVLLGAIALVACGGDDGGGDGSGGTSGGGSSSGGASSGGSSSGGSAGASSGGAAGASSGGSSSGGAASGGAAGSASGGASSGGAGGGDALAQCKAQAASNPNPACANCACDNCLNELKACEADTTCVNLRNCAQKNNCCDELCVLLKCGSELQAAGGAQGPGTTKASAVKDCTVKNTCNCCK